MSEQKTLQQIEWSGEISYAHIIHTNFKSLCYGLHGHNAEIHVMVLGEVNDDGMIIDFKKLKELVHEYDHKFLVPGNVIVLQNLTVSIIVEGNTLLQMPKYYSDFCLKELAAGTEVATSEYLSKELAEKILYSQENIMMVEITWSETKNSMASYTAKKSGVK
jgi:6-pyruvoyl-tetrahydropterin synthase